jgi:addiction module HigA family antidote
MRTTKNKDLILFHPGVYVKDLIEGLEMNQDDLSKQLGITTDYLSDFINGESPLSDELASKLSGVFGTSIELWLNLNATYIKKKMEIEQMKVENE